MSAWIKKVEKGMKSSSSSSFLIIWCLFLASPAWAKDCSRISTGQIPLTDGVGLYPGGNAIPSGHLQRGLDAAALIIPRDSNGSPSADGVIVLASIGVSNTSNEFARGASEIQSPGNPGIPFKARADADDETAPSVVIVDGARGGRPLSRWIDFDASAWSVMRDRLAASGVTTKQVQALWVKLPEASPARRGSGSTYISWYRKNLFKVIQNARRLFPGLQQVYFSSRIYARYGGNNLSPEPWAYWEGLGVRSIIERQLSVNPSWRPWLAWGPYLWADGLTPRSDGLIWECDDFAPDGIHPNGKGVDKVATILLAHFKTHPAACWFKLGGC